MTAPTSQPDYSSETGSQPNHPSLNGRFKSPLADHPEWREYLAMRHIREPAIAAGAWIERDKYAQQDALVWREKRRDGSPGALRRRLLEPVSNNGRKQAKVRWRARGQESDEPFYYAGSLDDLKREIAAAGGLLHILEGEVDVWSLETLDIGNAIGIYGVSNIPKDIASILDEYGVTRLVYYIDNDKAGERGASTMRTLLHNSGWKGGAQYRKVEGPGIAHKGDANDLLCHHHPNLAAARAALDALPEFVPGIKRPPLRKISPTADHDQGRWDAVNEAIRIKLGLGPSDFKGKGFTKKNFHCVNPQHDNKKASAGWSRDGNYKCFACDDVDSWQVAEWLGIDWRALLRPQPQRVSENMIDLDAAPQQTEAMNAPLAFEQPPDTWLRLLIKHYTQTLVVLYFYCFRALRAGLLAPAFTRGEVFNVLPALGCDVNKESFYGIFNEVGEYNNHPVFRKIVPDQNSSSKHCKFGLRPPEDMLPRLLHDLSFRVYEKKFRRHRDTLVGFEIFSEALQGSKFLKMLKSSLKPVYTEQKQRFESLTRSCEGIIAGYEADLNDLQATPLPDWTIDHPCEFPAMFARGFYDEDPEDRAQTEWMRLTGMSKGSINTVLRRAGILRTAYTMQVEVDSSQDALDQAREQGAKIMGVEVDGGYLPFDAAMDIPQGSKAILQPPAQHKIVSDDKVVIASAPAKPDISAAEATITQPAHNMRQPGNWHKSSWDPQFIYWELVKASCLLHGYQVKEGVDIYDPQTGEIWQNPTQDEVIALIIGPDADTERVLSESPAFFQILT